MADRGALGNLLVSIRATTNDWTEDVKSVAKDAKLLTSSLKEVTEGVKLLSEGMAVLGTAIVATFAESAKSLADYGTQLTLMNARTGISIENLQKLGFAAAANGSDLDGLAVAVKKLATNMELAQASGGKELAAFQAVGISAEDLANAHGNLAPILAAIADKFSTSADNGEKLAVTQALLGKGGLELIPLLNQGSAGIDKFGEAAGKAGKLLGDDAVKAAFDFHKQLVELEESISGLGLALGVAVLPSIKGFVESTVKVVQAVKDWAAAHPELLKAIAALGALLAGAGGILFAVTAIVAVLPALTAAFALVTGPVGLVIIGISALLALIIAFKNQIGGAVLYALSQLVEGFAALVAWAAKGAEAVGATGLATKLNKLKDATASSADKINDLAGSVLDAGTAVESLGKKTEDVGPPTEIFYQQQLKLAEANKLAAEQAKKFSEGVDKIVDSVNEEIKQGPELIAALEKLNVLKNDDSLIVDKLGKKILDYTDIVLREGKALDAVSQYYRDLAIQREVDNTNAAKQFDAAVALGLATEKNAATLKDYLNVQATSVINELTRTWTAHYSTLIDLQTKELGEEQDTAAVRIRLINETLAHELTYSQTIQDYATAVQQVKHDTDDASAAYHQTVLDYQSELDGAHNEITLRMLQDLANNQLKTWKEYQDEYQKLLKGQEDVTTSYHHKFYTTAQEAAEKMQISFSDAFGSISTGLAKGIADSIVHWTNFGDELKKLTQDFAGRVLTAFLEGMFNPLTNELKKLGAQFADFLQNMVSGSGQAASSIASSLSGSGGSGGGAGGLLGGLGGGLAGGLIGGAISAIATFATGARQEGTLNAIEYNTRATYINIAIAIDQLLKPMLSDLNNLVPNLAGGGGSSYQNAAVTTIAPAYQAILDQGYNSGASYAPSVSVTVQGSVVAERELQQVVRDAVYDTTRFSGGQAIGAQ